MMTQMIVVQPGDMAQILQSHRVIDLASDGSAPAASRDITVEPVTKDPIQASIMSNRFMGIAEQMGLTLQDTSVSVNIKERLDFSCNVFRPDGRLVANAPHVPVHLGSMEHAVRYQYNLHSKNLRPGDVLVVKYSAGWRNSLARYHRHRSNFRQGSQEYQFLYCFQRSSC